MRKLYNNIIDSTNRKSEHYLLIIVHSSSPIAVYSSHGIIDLYAYVPTYTVQRKCRKIFQTDSIILEIKPRCHMAPFKDRW